MEYDEDNAAAGHNPEVGAIFMASSVTKRECFKRGVFALPSSDAKFVKRIKTGTVLFLFEFEKRQLFGVYKASSAGAMDIVPDGFNYSGRRFRAQVPFTSIWSCDPLPENEFKDAIRENYFSWKKFNFGLSELQVRRLLNLFSPKRLQNGLPPPLTTKIPDTDGKDRALVDHDTLVLANRRYMEQSEYDEVNYGIMRDYQRSLLTRAKEDELLLEDRIYSEGKVNPLTESLLTDYHGDFLPKRRRMDDANRLMTSDEENATYSNHGHMRPLHDSLEDSRRLADGRRQLSVERACYENQLDNHARSSEYMTGSMDVRMDTDRLTQRNRYGQSFVREHRGDLLNKSDHAGDDRFLFDDCVRGEHNVRDIVKPLVYGDGNLNLRAQAREVTEDRQHLMNGMFENKYHMDNDGGNPALLSRIRTSAGGRLSTNEEIESGPNLGSCSVGSYSEKFPRPLHFGHRIIHDGKFAHASGRESEIMLESVSNKTSEYISRVNERVIDDGKLRMSRKVENLEDFHAFVNPLISTEYTRYSNPEQNLSSFSEKYLHEHAHPQLTSAHNLDPSRSRFNDATITRSVRYPSESPKFANGCSTSLADDRISDFVRENYPHHGSLGNPFSSSASRLSPQFLECNRSDRYLDIRSGHGNEGLPPESSSHQSFFLPETTNSFLNSNPRMQMELNASDRADYRGSCFLKPSTIHEQIELNNHFPLGDDLPMASQHMSQHVAMQEMDMLSDRNFVYSKAKDYGLGVYDPERHEAGFENQHYRTTISMNLNEQRQISEAAPLDSNTRRSVFTRLNSGKEVRVGEQRKDTHFSCQDSYMDSSADQVMDMLLQGTNLSTRKPKKSRVVGQPKHGECNLDEKLTQSHFEMNHSKANTLMSDLASAEDIEDVPNKTLIVDFKRRSKTKKTMVEANTFSGADSIINDLASAEDIKDVLNETRIVDFKRRSKTKKNLVEANTFADADRNSTADNGEVEVSKTLVEAKTFSGADNKINAVDEVVEMSPKMNLKRKKLVRPVFKKNESATDSTSNSQHLQLLGQILHKDDERTCQRAITTCEAKMPNESSMLSNVLPSISHQSVDFNVKEHSNAGVQNHIEEAQVTSSTFDELKAQKTSNVGAENDASHLIEETTERENLVTQTSVQGIASKDNDATVAKLNMEESSSEGLKRGGNCGNDPREVKRFRMSKNKKKVIRLGK